MKQNLLLILIFFLSILLPVVLESCDTPNVQTNPTVFKYGIAGNTVSKYIIDGHEYIGLLQGSQSDWATHSGTCQHPSHKCKTDTVYVTIAADTVYCVITPSGTRILEKRK